jgi:hypothetical protein
MKIALTVSGQPRRARNGFYELKKWFLDRYDIDVYLHGWIDKQFYKYDFFNDGVIQKVHNVENNLYQNIIEWYQPKGHLFEKSIKFDATDLKGSHNQRLNSQMGMWMSLKRAWDLLEESEIKYDLVIRTRYDLLFTHNVANNCIFLEDITKVDPNFIHVFKYPARWNMAPQINDHFAVGGYDLMKVYHNLFPNMIHHIFDTTEYRDIYEDMFVNEPLIYHHLVKNNVPLNEVEHGFNGWRGIDAGAQIMR